MSIRWNDHQPGACATHKIAQQDFIFASVLDMPGRKLFNVAIRQLPGLNIC